MNGNRPLEEQKMPTSKKDEAAPVVEYTVLIGFDYMSSKTDKWCRVEPGVTVNDMPPADVDWLQRAGAIVDANAPVAEAVIEVPVEEVAVAEEPADLTEEVVAIPNDEMEV